MKRFVLIAMAAASLAACATPYGQSGGVYETRIAEDRYRVSFQGRGGPDYAFDQALVRAAHLALRDGRDWFVVEDRYTETDRGGGGGPSISIGGGSTDFGRFSASSLGVGIGFNLGDLARPRAATSLQIRTGAGGLRPEGAYDARDVIATVGPRLGDGPA